MKVEPLCGKKNPALGLPMVLPLPIVKGASSLILMSIAKGSFSAGKQVQGF
jgi:hypothetical protein